jgi:hypothetical protein
VSFLLDHYDPALEVSLTHTPELLTDSEQRRLNYELSLATAVGSFSRRLGQDASQEELALDKLRARRVKHALEQSLKAWGGTPAVDPEDAEIRRAAAVVNWTKWHEDHNTWLTNRTRYIVTWSQKTERTHENWTKSAVVRLENERRWLAYAMRD